MDISERYTERLAKYILIAAGVGIVAALCWYFSSVLIYIQKDSARGGGDLLGRKRQRQW